MMTRILVIEDEIHIRENIIETLEMEDFEVHGADDGVAGVQMALRCPPDLVICDIMMDGLDGYQVLEALRMNAATAATPFIFLSALAERRNVRQGMELGADDYLTKPFAPVELLSAVQSRLKRQQIIHREAEKKLEGVKKQIAHMVAHELRTPASAITMVLDIISRQVDLLDTAQLQELLDVLSTGSERMNRTVEQMVYLSQLELGTLSRKSIASNGLEKQMWELMVSTLNLARRFAPHNPSVEIRLNERDTETVIVCDPNAFKQALAEIIGNAITYSPQDGVITISQWAMDGWVYLAVEDQGQGIAPENIQTALEGFQQIDRETHEQQGMGIGLMLANRIVEAHGGKLGLKSMLGKGTQVRIKLPVWNG